MAGFSNDVLFGTNVDFSGSNPVVGQVNTNGQLLIGSSVSPNIRVGNLTSGTLTITNGNGTINIESGPTLPITFTGNTGGPESSIAGNFNILGTGSITVAGTSGTETIQLTGLTNHNVLIGASTSTVTKVAPSSTSGVPLISQGSTSDPAFGTAVVAGGGTGQVTLTNHGVLIGQATSAIAATAAGTAGQVLQSGGASADPVYSTATYPSTAGTSGNILTSNGTNWTSAVPDTFSQVVIQVFTSSGTYTPTSGMKYCVVECVGGGGGGGGIGATGVAEAAGSGGGAGGTYARSAFSAATISAPQSITIGAGGTAGANTPANGGQGGNTLLAALIQGTGGNGGVLCTATTSMKTVAGGIGAATSAGTVAGGSTCGGCGISIFNVIGIAIGGAGGASAFGGGGANKIANGSGNNGILYGGGASGTSGTNTAAAIGGTGAAGLVVVTEYI